MTAIARRGLMLVLSSPSGAGKTTLSRALLASEANIALSVSMTTRPMRAGEREGVDYFFVSPERFEAAVRNGDFLEHAVVFDHRYGTPVAPVIEALAVGRDVLFDIDWQGTQQLKEKAREDLVSIFVLPPSRPELERRLRVRAQDTEEVVSRRMAMAADEISHWAEYDYALVNDSLETALSKVVAVLRAERLKRARQTGLSRFVRSLQQAT
jgi:guanylate kinase